jgi:hypothetical protein
MSLRLQAKSFVANPLAVAVPVESQWKDGQTQESQQKGAALRKCTVQTPTFGTLHFTSHLKRRFCTLQELELGRSIGTLKARRLSSENSKSIERTIDIQIYRKVFDMQLRSCDAKSRLKMKVSVVIALADKLEKHSEAPPDSLRLQA